MSVEWKEAEHTYRAVDRGIQTRPAGFRVTLSTAELDLIQLGLGHLEADDAAADALYARLETLRKGRR